MSILDQIIAHKREEVEARKKVVPLQVLKNGIEEIHTVRDFKKHLKRGDEPVKLLAEIKAASPSSGTIRDDFDAAHVASLFESCGASAISVLTDWKYFSGTDQHLVDAWNAVSLPVLRKDFTIDAYQLYESRALGADAVLLMAQVLEPELYKDLLQEARVIGLQVLAEGHTEAQIEFLVSIGVEVIGINNRDFTTMKVDLNTTITRRRIVPEDRVLVSQSGIFTREDVERLEAVNVDAIQVGTSIMKDDDMQGQIQRLLGIES